MLDKHQFFAVVFLYWQIRYAIITIHVIKETI